MIDVTQPVELDNGRLMERFGRAGQYSARFRPVDRQPWNASRSGNRDYERSGEEAFYYDLNNGVFLGSSAKQMFVLRNCAEEAVEPEDWS